MPFGRPHLKELFGTLRVRLTLWSTAIVLLMVVVTLLAVRESLHYTLRIESDKQLVDDATEIKLLLEQSHTSRDELYAELDRKAISHSHRGFFVRVFDTADNLRWSSVNTPGSPYEGDRRAFERPVSQGNLRIVRARIVQPAERRGVVEVGVSTAALEADVAQLTRLMLAVGAAVLIVAPLGGVWLAGRATRPLAQIIDTTGRLHPSSLDERLPLRGTGDELDRLSRTINGFLDRIADYLQQIREFTANAAHELRSPLAAIQNSLEVALNADRSVDDYKEMLVDLLEECENLAVLVKQLLLLAESDAGLIAQGHETAQLDELVVKAYQMFQGVAEAAGIDLQVVRNDAVAVRGDGGRLRQVINNVVDNALKFTPAGGRVEVDLQAQVDRAVLEVRDTGAGIPIEDMPHLFERFYRADKARRREKNKRGTGLGLSICKAILRAYDGTIELQSMIDRGTTVTITLPRVFALAPSDSHPELISVSTLADRHSGVSALP